MDFSTGWNGTYKSVIASAGTYVWVASYTNSDMNQRNLRKGYVILIR